MPDLAFFAFKEIFYRVYRNFNLHIPKSQSLFDYSFVLQGVVWIKVQNATSVFASKLDECKSIIQNSSVFFKPMNSSDGKFYSSGLERYQQLRYEMLMYNNTYSYGYWLRGSAHATILIGNTILYEYSLMLFISIKAIFLNSYFCSSLA